MKLRKLLLVLALAGAVLGVVRLLAQAPGQKPNTAMRQAPLNQKTQEPAAAPTHRPKHHVVFLRLGPNYVKGRPPQEQPGFAGHAEHIAKLAKAGTLLLGGPFVEDFSTMAVTGAMEVLSADTGEEARRIAEADPFVASGALEIEKIRPFVVGAMSVRPESTPAR
jgi:uncharacterized protein YciI